MKTLPNPLATPELPAAAGNGSSASPRNPVAWRAWGIFVGVLLALASLGIVLYFSFLPSSLRAKAFTVLQTTWDSVSATIDLTALPGDNKTVTAYASKDVNLGIVNSNGDLKLTLPPWATTHTTKADFDTGTKDGVMTPSNSTASSETTQRFGIGYSGAFFTFSINYQQQAIAVGADGFPRIVYKSLLGKANLWRCTDSYCGGKVVTVIDNSRNAGNFAAIMMASDGFPRISYYDDSNQDLIFVQCQDADCATNVSTAVDSTGDVGSYTSLALGADGFGRISYYDTTNADLKFVQCTNSACSTSVVTTVDSTGNVGSYTSLSLGSDGYARIAYQDTTNANLKYVQCTNAACATSNITTVVAGSVGHVASALGSDDFGRILYQKTSDTSAQYIQCTNASCATSNATTIEAISGVNLGQYPAIALAPDGFPRLSYADTTHNRLRYVQCANAACTSKNITPENIINSGLLVAMALGTDGLARIASFDSATFGFKIYQCTDDRCERLVQARTIDSTGDVGNYSSVQVASDGFARVAYYDTTNGDLKFVQCTNADCTSNSIQTVDSTGDVGRNPSLTLGADGFARISYYDATNGNLKFVQCTNADCSTYATPVAVDTVGQNTSLVLGSDGFGRISYTDPTNGLIYFVQCTNADCSTHTTPVQVADLSGSYNSLALGSDGFARIAYYVVVGQDLHLIQCTNADCSTNNNTALDTTGNVGQYPSIAMGSDGFARISYYDLTNADLKFVQCTNDACSTNNINSVDTGGSVGRFSSVKMASDGFARISYEDATNKTLKVAVCTNAACSSSAISTVDFGPQVGQWTSLALGSDDSGYASEYDVTNQDLKLVRLRFTGTLTSAIIDTGQASDFTTLSWSEALNGQTLKMKVRSCDDAGCVGEASFGTITETACTSGCTIGNGGNLNNLSAVVDGQRYIQYQAILTMNRLEYDYSIGPQINDITLNYQQYDASMPKTLTSSALDSTDSSNLLNQVQWTEDATLPAGTSVKVQIRTSSNGSSWTSYMGPAGTGGASDVFSNSASGCSKVSTTVTCAIPNSIAIGDGSNDEWMQYQVTLDTTNFSNTPTFSDITLGYVNNTAPQVSSVTAQENGSGVINISYNLADNEAASDTFNAQAFYDIGLTLNDEGGSLDTTGTGETNLVLAGANASLLPSSGTVMVENEVINYSAKSGDSLTLTIADSGRGVWPTGGFTTKAASHTNGVTVWVKPTTTTGTGTVTVGNGKAATWNVKTDINNFYIGTSNIRVAVNDGNIINQVGVGQASSVVLDTKDPSLGANVLILDSTGDGVADTTAQSRTITLKLQNITEDSNLKVQFSNDNINYGRSTNSGTGAITDSGSDTVTIGSLSSYTNSWTLLTGNGSHTVYAKIADIYGNPVSPTAINASISSNITPEFDATYTASGDATYSCNAGICIKQLTRAEDAARAGFTAIKFKVRDQDTDESAVAPGAGTARVFFKYSTNGGADWSYVTGNMSGDGQAQSANAEGAITRDVSVASDGSNTTLDTAYTEHTLYWDAKSEIGEGTYASGTNFKLMIFADDLEADNNRSGDPATNGGTASGGTSLDIKNPALSTSIGSATGKTGIVIHAVQGTVADDAVTTSRSIYVSYAATEDTTTGTVAQFATSSSSGPFGNVVDADGTVTADGQEAYSTGTQTKAWTLGKTSNNATKTVWVKFIDAYGNTSSVGSDTIDYNVSPTVTVDSVAQCTVVGGGAPDTSTDSNCTTGRVKVTYTVQDQSTHEATGSNTIDSAGGKLKVTSLKYSTNGGSSYSSAVSTIYKATSDTLTSISAGTATLTLCNPATDSAETCTAAKQFTLYWDAKNDANNTFSSSARVRLDIDDGERNASSGTMSGGALATANNESGSNAVLDTKDPIAAQVVAGKNGIVVSKSGTPADDASLTSRSATLHLNISDDSSQQVNYSQDNTTFGTGTDATGLVTGSGSWEAYATSKSWTLATPKLSGSINSTANTISADTFAGLAADSSGWMKIGSERIYYGARDDNATQFLSVARGQADTSAASHAANDPIEVDGVRTVTVNARDIYGNTIAAKPQDDITYDQTPAGVIKNFGLQDLSNADLESWQLYLSWRKLSDPLYGSGLFSSPQTAFSKYTLYRCTHALATVTATDCTTLQEFLSFADVGSGNINANSYTDDFSVTDAGNSSPNTTKYFYLIRAEDAAGNLTPQSAIISLVPNGSGGRDSIAPLIGQANQTDETVVTHVDPDTGVSSATPNGATIYWNSTYAADDPSKGDVDRGQSDSYVEVSTDTTNDTPSVTYEKIFGKDDYATVTAIGYLCYAGSNAGASCSGIADTQTCAGGGSCQVSGYRHAVTLESKTDFAPATTYHYRVRSRDSSGNQVISGDKTFVTKSLAQVSSVNCSGATASSVTIGWDTQDASDSFVEYGPENSQNGTYAYIGIQGLADEKTTGHQVTLVGLAEDTKYHFQVASKDTKGNAIPAPTDFVCPKTLSTADTTAPVISNVQVPPSSVTDASVVILWSTNEPATTQIYTTTQNPQLSLIPVAWAAVSVSPASPSSGPLDALLFRGRLSVARATGALANRIDLASSAVGFVAGVVFILTLFLVFIVVSYARGGYAFRDILRFAPVVAFRNASGGFAALAHSDETGTWQASYSVFQRHHSLARRAFAVTILALAIRVAFSTPLPYLALTNFSQAAANYTAGTLDATLNTSHRVEVTGLAPSTQYWFYVASQDSSGNTATSLGLAGSPDNFTTAVTPDSTPPTISSVAVSPAATRATVTWTTDEASSSFVDYTSTVTGSGDSLTYTQPKTAGDETLSTSHEVSLTGLASDVLHHFMVRSKDASGNEIRSSDRTFTTSADTVPPVIFQFVAGATTSTKAFISWQTNEPATSQLEYGKTQSYGSVTGEDAHLSYSHYLILEGLTPLTSYHGRATSRDAQGNVTTSLDIAFTTKASTSAEATPRGALAFWAGSPAFAAGNAPLISSFTVSDTFATSAILTWRTDTPSSSFVEYGETDALGYFKGNEEDVTQHRVTLIGLTPLTTYRARAISRDASGNETRGVVLVFTTGAVESLDTEPPAFSNVSAEDITDKSAVIAVASNEDADALVEYGMTSAYGISVFDPELTTSHQIALPTTLQVDVTYHYRVRVRDRVGNETITDDYTFTTATPPDSLIPPKIVGQQTQVTDLHATSAAITWKTDKASSSLVAYGTSDQYGVETGRSFELVRDHSVTIVGLAPETTYHFQVRSQSTTGLLARSPDATFTTPAVPVVSGVVISDVGLTNATISWETNTVTTSSVEYGKSLSYGETIEDVSLGKTTQHTVRISDLANGTLYHVRIAGSDVNGDAVYSDDYVFQTVAIPVISESRVASTTSQTAVIEWTTNTRTDSLVSYRGPQDTDPKTAGSTDPTTEHSVKLENLAGNTTYVYTIIGRDVFGNEIRSKEDSFITAADTSAPRISGVKTEMNIPGGGNDTVQLLIFWATDEPATSQVEYREGAGKDYDKKTKLDDSLTANHIVVLSGLKTATSYHFRTMSSDTSGNAGASTDYTILTPQQRESLLQIILKNLEDTFGWIKRIRGA